MYCTALNLYVLFTAVNAGVWYAQIGCEDDVLIPTSKPCGTNSETACCHLRDVLNNMEQHEDTVYLLQMSKWKQLPCEEGEEITVNVWISKSLTLGTVLPKGYSI